jgi:hypothetical protein
MKLSKAKRRANAAALQTQSSEDTVTFTEDQRNLILVTVHEAKLDLLNRIIDLLLKVRKAVTI